MDWFGIEHQIPVRGEFFECDRSAKPPLHMQVPIPRRDAALLPILPARIVFDGRPKLLRRQRQPGCHPFHRATQIDAYQHPPDIKNNRANLPLRPVYLASPRATARRARKTLITTGSTDTKTTTAIT